VEIPHARVDALFLGYLSPISEFIEGLFGDFFGRTFRGTLRGPRLGFRRGSWRLLEDVFGIDFQLPWEDDSSRPSSRAQRGFYYVAFLLSLIFSWHCIAP